MPLIMARKQQPKQSESEQPRIKLASRPLAPKRAKQAKSLDYRNFDGQIISVIDMALTDDRAQPLLNDNTYFFDPVKGNYATFNNWWRPVMLQALAKFEEAEAGRSEMGRNARWIARRMEAMKDALEQTPQVIREHFLPPLMEGRLKMSLLMDSPGGDVAIYYPFDALLCDVQRRGGHVDAYVDTKASSAAARLFLGADRRFAHSRSSMLIHGGYDERTGLEVENWSFASMERTMELLQRASKPDRSDYFPQRRIWDFVLGKMDENSNRYLSGDPYALSYRPSDVEFGAAELKRFGIAKVVASLEEMMQRFFQETGIDPGKITEQMRLIHSLGRPGFKEKPAHIEPVAQFYINALEREDSV